MTKRFAAFTLSLILLFSLSSPAFAAASTKYTLTGNEADDIVAVAVAQDGLKANDLGLSGPWCGHFLSWCAKKAGSTHVSQNITGGFTAVEYMVNNGLGNFYYFSDSKTHPKGESSQSFYNYLKTYSKDGHSVSKAGLTRVHEVSRSSFTPKKGDIVIFLWSDDNAHPQFSHVGFVRSDYNGKGTVYTVEGNTRGYDKNGNYTSGVVELKSHSYKDTQIVGFVRPNYSGSGSTTSGSSASLTLNKSSFSLDVGAQATIGFSFTGTISNVDFSIANTNICSYVTGEWKQSTKQGSLTFKALSPGQTTIKINLKDSKGNILTSKTATITVKGDPLSLSFSPSSLSLDPGSSKTVSIGFTGEGIYNMAYGIANTDVCSAAWGETSYSSGKSSLTITGKQPGSTTVTIYLRNKSGETIHQKSFTVTVNEYKTTLTASASTVNLDLSTKPSQKITLELGGNLPSGTQLSRKSSDSNIATYEWDNYTSGTTINVLITGKNVGTATLTFGIVDSARGKTLATKTVTVNVTAPTYTVSFNANGGSGAPGPQTKQFQKTLAISSVKPTRTGYTFNGWATSANGSVSYMPGSSYTADANATLYAVWEPNSGISYFVKHYQESLSGDYVLADTDKLTGTAGESISLQPREYEGFISPSAQTANVPLTDGETVIDYYYDRAEYNVVLRAGDGIASVFGKGVYSYGETVEIGAEVLDGYEWSAWTSSFHIPGSKKISYQFTMPAGDVVMLANAEKLPEPDVEPEPEPEPEIKPEPEPEIEPDLPYEEPEIPEEDIEEDPCEWGHSWGSWQTDIDATCEDHGRRVRTCQVCGEDEFEGIPASGHNYTMQETKNSVIYTCSVCGDQYSENIESDDKDSSYETLDNFEKIHTYSTGSFDDVRSSDWFSDNVKIVYEYGLMNGVAADSFSPHGDITIAQAVTMAARLHSIYYSGDASFTMFDSGAWYNPYVEYAKDVGILTEPFNYDQFATREQFVYLLSRALPKEALPDIRGTISFADWHDVFCEDEVELLVRAGVINGSYNEDGLYFLPQKTISRAEAAAVMSRMILPDMRSAD